MAHPLTIGRTLVHCRRHKLEVVGNCSCAAGLHQPIDLGELPACMADYTIDELHRRRVFECSCGRIYRAVLVFGDFWGMRTGVEEWPLNRRCHVRQPGSTDGIRT